MLLNDVFQSSQFYLQYMTQHHKFVFKIFILPQTPSFTKWANGRKRRPHASFQLPPFAPGDDTDIYPAITSQ